MPVKQLKEFLDSNNVKYVSITHSTAYTAQEIAALTHTKGRDMAKTVIVKLGDSLAMAVLPASFRADLEHLKEGIGVETISLATESEFRARFPGCETGAMPPFGNLYGMEVYVAESLMENEEIAFNAGSHTEVIKVPSRDFERLVRPKVMSFTT